MSDQYLKRCGLHGYTCCGPCEAERLLVEKREGEAERDEPQRDDSKAAKMVPAVRGDLTARVTEP